MENSINIKTISSNVPAWLRESDLALEKFKYYLLKNKKRFNLCLTSVKTE